MARCIRNFAPARHFVCVIAVSLQVYRKIINCCTNLNLHTHVSFNFVFTERHGWLFVSYIHVKPQAVLFCQLLVPVDYELAFSLLSNHSRCPILVSFYTLYISNTIYTVFPYSSMVESYFSYFWDMVVIEYLICILTKPRQTVSQSKLSRS